MFVVRVIISFVLYLAGMKMAFALLLIVYVSLVGAQIHHVVGDNRGSAKASEVKDWLFDKVFRVGAKGKGKRSSGKKTLLARED